MSLREDVRECPATYGLAASWVVVYLAMLAVQGGATSGGGFLDFGGIDSRIAGLFGDLTWRDFARGEVWRVLTASFIHFSATHLAMNLVGMIQLGRLMEPWYGARQFLAICLGLGASGNLLGVLMRQAVAAGRTWLQAHGMARALPAALAGGAPGVAETIPSGGGSTVLLGLIGLGMVVGWRSRTRVGAFLRDQMVAVLAITAILGVAWFARIDNYGHAGGALAGAALGFLHRRLVRTPERGPARRVALWGSVLVLLGCVAAQAHVARGTLAEARRAATLREAETRLRALDALIDALGKIQAASRIVAFERAVATLEDSIRRGDPSVAVDADLSTAFEMLVEGSLPSVKDRIQAQIGLIQQVEILGRLGPVVGPDLADGTYREAVALGRALTAGPVDARSLYALRVDIDDLVRRARRDREGWRARRDALAPEAPAL